MRKQTNAQVPQLSSELANAELGDERLNRRLGKLVDRMSERPGDSFPKAMDDAELEAAYRFFGNERVTPEAILEPHLRATTKRARRHDRITVIHDTTEFEFPGDAQREGLGRLLRPGQGFFGHFALAASADGKRLPLGLLGLKTIFRVAKPIGHKNWERSKSRGESARWRELVAETEERLDGTHAIHVMDREGDSYATLSALHEHGWLFVIRSCHDRRLVDGDVKLWDTAREAARVVEREVALSPRPKIAGPKGKRHPARRSRLATLSVAAAAVELPRTVDGEGSSSATMKINVVHVIEVDTAHRGVFQSAEDRLPIREASAREQAQLAQRARDPRAGSVAAAAHASSRTTCPGGTGPKRTYSDAARGTQGRLEKATSSTSDRAGSPAGRRQAGRSPDEQR